MASDGSMPKTTHTDTVSWLGGEAQSRVEGDMTETVVQYFPALTLANTGMATRSVRMLSMRCYHASHTGTMQ
jgi:hypothetical protein